MTTNNPDPGQTSDFNHVEHDAQSRNTAENQPTEQDDSMITQFAEPITREEVTNSDVPQNAPVAQNSDSAQKGGTNSPRFPELTQELEKDLVQIFKLLADETRLKILFYLGREKELHVSALCERLGQSQPAVSHHLALLRVAGLIEPRRDGKHNFYSVQQSTFHEIVGELFKSFTEESETNEVRFDDFTFRQEGK